MEYVLYLLAVSLPLVSTCLYQVLHCAELGVTVGCHQDMWFLPPTLPTILVTVNSC